MNGDYDPLYLFINGEWIGASERDTASVVNPARSANAIAGTSPACDTRLGSSNTTDRTGTA